jgi:hypothetical protein
MWKFEGFYGFNDYMPKAEAITTHGLGFEDALRKMLNTPPPPSSKSAKKAAKKPKRKSKNYRRFSPSFSVLSLRLGKI